MPNLFVSADDRNLLRWNVGIVMVLSMAGGQLEVGFCAQSALSTSDLSAQVFVGLLSHPQV